MTSNDTRISHLPYAPAPMPAAARQLLRTFGHSSLGDGDEVAGMNTLVSMCAALSAAAGPDARVRTDDNIELDPAIHWLVSGSLSPALHEQRVIAPLRESQNVITQNMLLAKQKMPAAQDARKPVTLPSLDPGRKLPDFSPGQMATAMDRMVLEEIQPDADGDRDFTKIASRLLQRGALHEPAEFYARAGILHDGTDPKVLSLQLKQSHRGYPLVDFPLSTRDQTASAGAALLGIMDGRGMQTALPIHVRGIATARMPGGLHGELLADGAFSPWMNRMLWLTDMPSGPLPSGEKVVAIDNPAKRYRHALDKLLTARLGEKPVVLSQKGLLSCHQDFLRHLASLETAIPGITGSLKNLVSTLYFGLRQLLLAGGTPEGFTWSLDQIASLATHLADRMAHAAITARRAHDHARREHLAASFCAKLAERPHTDRDLVRRHNKLPIALCRDVLADLHTAGYVTLHSGSWHLAPCVVPAKPQPPTIDVP